MARKRLFAIFLLFLCTFSLFSEKKYIKNPVKEFEIEDSKENRSKSIPLTVSYYNDETAEMDCGDLDKVEFTNTAQVFNPGFFKGVLWCDITFVDTQSDGGNDLYLYLGNRHIDLAEAYTLSSSGWTLIGWTGRSIKREQMSVPSWKLIIPIDSTELDRNIYHHLRVKHLRVKIVSNLGIPIDLRLLSKGEFYNQSMVNSAMSLTLEVICLLITIILFVCGCFFRDYIYRLIAIASLFLLLLILQLKGIGPVYLWNWLALMSNSSRLVYLFSTCFFIFSILVLKGIFVEANVRTRGNILMYVITGIITACCLFSLFLKSPFAAFIVYGIGLIVCCILFIFSIFLYRDVRISESFRILRIFVPVMMIVAIAYSYFLMRLFTKSVTLLKIVDYDYFYYDFCYLLLTLPALYFTVKRFGLKFRHMEKKLAEATQNENEYNKDRNLFHAMVRQLLTLSNLIRDSIHLPQLKTENDSVREIQAIIERSSVQMIDYLNAIMVFGTKKEPEKTPILLSSFFDGCLSVINTSAARKGVKISVSKSLDDEYAVRANRNILEMIISHFMLNIIRSSATNSNIVLSVSQNQEEVSLKTKFYVNPGDEKYMDSMLNDSQEFFTLQNKGKSFEDIGFRLVIKTLELYDGTFSYSKDKKSYKVSITMKFPEDGQSLEKASGQTLFDSESQKELNNSTDPVPVVDSIFADAGKTIVILFVEESVVAKRFWEDVLNGQCIVKTAATGVEAWNYLHTPDNPKPDIIISNYNLPLMNGRELYRKCSDDDNTKDIPFVFILSPADSDKKDVLMRRGVVDCIVTP
ncbi:MAG: response regulator, partial [Treponema sp.]|nr:response regulator [Treponema sp.]